MCWYFHSFKSFGSFFKHLFHTLCFFCVFVTILAASVVTKQHNTPFQSHHAVGFSLRICERSAGVSPVVVTAVWRLCEVYIKEEAVVVSKCRCSERFNYFEVPFYKDNYCSHNKLMHISKWTEYYDMDAGTKSRFLILSASLDYRQRCMHMTGITGFFYVCLLTRKLLI